MEENAKRLKLYYLSEILKQETDEDHPLSTAELLQKLEQRGIFAERKSIFRDVALLQAAGMDIISCHKGYYCASLDFETAEVLSLADAVSAARFLTEKKSRALLDKLSLLTGVSGKKRLSARKKDIGQRKSENEAVFYTLDAIHRASSEQKWLQFHYFEWRPDFSTGGKFVRHARRRGDFYTVAVKGMVWAEENDYLVGYDAFHKEIRSYRIDRMEDVTLTDKKVPVLAELDFDLSDYAAKSFSMFSGRTEKVTMRFPYTLANAVKDRFGDACFLMPDDETHFLVSSEVTVSPKFFGWLMGFDGQVELLGPPSAVTALQEQAKKFG